MPTRRSSGCAAQVERERLQPDPAQNRFEVMVTDKFAETKCTASQSQFNSV